MKTIKQVICTCLALWGMVGMCAVASSGLSEEFRFSSPAFADGGNLPKIYTCDGESASPPVAWKNSPRGTVAFALTMHHVAVDNERHVYWVVANIPGDVTQIEKNSTKAGVMGLNTQNDQPRYSPPCSKGPGPKTYTLTLYALSAKAELPNHSPTMDDLLNSIKKITIASKTLKVIYSRPPGHAND